MIWFTRGLVTYDENATAVTYKGTGTVDLALGLKAHGKIIIAVEEGITEIGDFAFCQETIPLVQKESFIFQNVYLPRSLVKIGKYAFSSADSQLVSLFFPFNSGNETDKENFYALREIGEGAFMNCDKLTKANVPATFTVVNNFVFKGVTQITGNTLNSKTTKIGIGSFQDCTLLNKFVIPSKVTSVGELAFGNCTSLKTITCQTQSCEFGGECFKNCLALQEFTFPKEAHLCILGGFFENCASLTKCTMPKTLKDKDGIQSSTLNMFSNCQNLKTVTLPDNIDSLGIRMFQNTSIETLYQNQFIKLVQKP